MRDLEYELRTLSIQDIKDLVALTDEIEWFFPDTYWTLLIATGHVFGLYSPDNELAATTTIFDYGDTLAFLGVVIVRDKYRGNGLATRVIDAAEKSVQRANRPVALIATSDGKPVYESRGYTVVGECLKLMRTNKTPLAESPSLPGFQFKPIQADNLKSVVRFDLANFGADRRHVLTALLATDNPSICLVDTNSDAVLGYALTFKRNETFVIGPVVAENATHAAAMVHMLCYGREEPVRIDILSHQGDFKAALENLSFDVVEISPVMQLGPGEHYSVSGNSFALTSQALG